ncbi:MAG TPA: MFS transporter [Bdellovibrionales bacterium]|nr:MAG: hypothetical protein A2Z97_07040 [Bdellovibrionales bacterium GWB1_52_6]OFZ06277.1 MAG: hypothetical protein A2X97_02325 [Bdellovibrionales bacterium GWA1_52_35]HAR42390.1 MFS transporter [Bdellovibrionales bacterium]HCM40026.1 MFS transporter [Bdellovibrionales bacterium]
MKAIPRTVWILGIVSLLTDASSEMIYPLLPIFLSQTLGASALALGAMEGLAEATASILKLFSGIWADRVRHRKPFLIAGYGLAGMVRPLIGLAPSWGVVLALRISDRIGKGLRSSPRDALIADATPAHQRGLAYGFHRSMDHAGAVAGPLIAGTLLMFGTSLRNVFLLAAIPAALTLLVLIFGLKEPQRELPKEDTSSGRASPEGGVRAPLSFSFKWLLAAILIFTLGNSTDAFLLLKLSDSGISAGTVATLWSLHHVVKLIATYWGGRASDRFGRKWLIFAGWIFYALIYLGFAWSEGKTEIILLFLGYGIYYGLTEPVEKALVADLAPKTARGTAFGYYHFIIGLGALPASLIFGWVWHRFGSGAAFSLGAGLSALAAVLLLFMPVANHQRETST